MFNFDQLLEEQIKMGKYQLTCFVLSALLSTSIGISSIQLSLFLSLYQGEHGLSISDLIALATIYRIGNLLAGFFILNCTNHIGKIASIEISIITNVIGSLMAFQEYRFDKTCIIFLTQGFQQGVLQQISHLITVEVIVKSGRGKITTILTVFQAVGTLLPIILCLYYCESFSKGNIPALFFYNVAFNVVLLVILIIFGRENPRFYLSQGRFSESFMEMNQMLLTNQCEMIQLSRSQKDQIIQWFDQNFRKQTENQELGLLFRQALQITIYSCVFYTTYYTLSSIQQYIVPFVLGHAKKGFYAFLSQQVLMIPAVLFQGFIIVDNEQIGRTKSGFGTSLILGLAYIGVYYFHGRWLVLLLSVIRFFLTILLTVTQVIVSEAYNSTLRVMGLSFTYSVAKFTQLIAPWFIFKIYEINPYYPFLFAGLILFVNSILFTTCPRDRTNKQLEQEVSESTNNPSSRNDIKQ